jgi:hypothetical protein
MDKAAGEPQLPVGGLKYLIIRIISLRVPFVIEASGLLPDTAVVG